MSDIPAGPEHVTAEWLSSVTGWNVSGVELTEIGAGLGVSSAVYRATLSGSDCPESVVVKLTAADEAAAFTSTVLGMYRREVEFFRRLASTAPVRVPRGYHGQVSDDNSQVVVVMEDMRGNRMCDQVEGMGIEDAERSVDALANWHAKWWRDVDGLAECGAALPLGNDVYPAMLPPLFAEGWAKLTASSDCPPPDSLLHIGERWGSAAGELLRRLDQDPVTVLHGDYRADNIMFSPEGEPIAIDFQLTHIGSAAYDLAYFITQSIAPDDASTHEAALFERWKQGLASGGVAAADLARAWDDYRTAALFCLAYPVIASRGMDLDDLRQAGLVNTMMERYARAAEELELADVL